MKSLIRIDHFGYIVEGFYVIVLHLWRHYKQIQALKGNTLTGTDSRGDAEVCTSVTFFFFFHTHGLRERDLTAHCLVMRSNQLTGSSCENGETVLNFSSVFSVQQSILKTISINVKCININKTLSFIYSNCTES